MNIGVYFEVGGFNTLTTSDSIIDQYATLAQAESQSHSENVKFGMRRRMESGRTILNHTQFLGYKKGEDGDLKIIPEEAEIVRNIFKFYVQGNGVRKIKKYLEGHGIKRSPEKLNGAPPPLTGCCATRNTSVRCWCKRSTRRIS